MYDFKTSLKSNLFIRDLIKDMWLEILSEINKKQSVGNLNLRFDLHIAIYIVEVLKSIVKFEITDGKMTIKIGKGEAEEVISPDDFYYWWQITRYNEIYKEELDLISKMREVDQTIRKLTKSRDLIKDNDEKKKLKKIDDLETKIVKLTNYMNKENPEFKQKITILSNFRNSYHTRDILDKLLNSVEFNLIKETNLNTT